MSGRREVSQETVEYESATKKVGVFEYSDIGGDDQIKVSALREDRRVVGNSSGRPFLLPNGDWMLGSMGQYE